MNTEIIYTVGVGNVISYSALIAMQLLLYFSALDLNKPLSGILVGSSLALILSGIGSGLIHFYNSEMAVKDDARVVMTIKQKKRVFRIIMITFYSISIAIITSLYFMSDLIGNHYLFTGPLSLIILFIVIGIHDLSVSSKYSFLSRAHWVF